MCANLPVRCVALGASGSATGLTIGFGVTGGNPLEALAGGVIGGILGGVHAYAK